MEFTLSIFAWLGVVILQAMVHYALKTRARSTDDDVPNLEASPLVLEKTKDAQEPASVSENSRLKEKEEQKCAEATDEAATGADDGSLDGDEPQIFFQLLSQTGCEMMNSTRSMEFIVKEQMVYQGRTPSCH